LVELAGLFELFGLFELVGFVVFVGLVGLVGITVDGLKGIPSKEPPAVALVTLDPVAIAPAVPLTLVGNWAEPKVSGEKLKYLNAGPV
jgi:hypothetical protein